jgi:O-antigen ligase
MLTGLAAGGGVLAAVSYSFDVIGLLAVLVLLLVAIVVVWAVEQRRTDILWVVYASSMVALPLTQGRVSIGGLLVPPPGFVAILAMFIIAIGSMRERRSTLVSSRAYVWLALMFLGFAISLPFARFMDVALAQFAKWGFHAVVVVLLGSMTERRWQFLTVQVLGLATGGLAAYGLTAYLWGDRYDVNFYEGIGTRSASGMHLAIVLPLLIALIGVRGIGAFHRGVLATAAGVSVIALAFTYARAGWVALLVALLLMAVMGRQGGALVGLLLVSVVLVLWAPETVQERFESIFSLGGWGEHSSVSNSTRLALMQQALSVIEENPFVGTGLGNYVTVIPWYAYNPEATRYGAVPHNIYLLVWAEGGLFALMGLLGFLGTIGSQLLRALRSTTVPASRTMLIGLLGSWTAVVTFMIFGDDFNHLLVWTALGLGISGARIWRDSPTVAHSDDALVRVPHVERSALVGNGT